MSTGECKELCKEHPDCEAFQMNTGDDDGCVFYTGLLDIHPSSGKNCYKRNGNIYDEHCFIRK